MILTNRKKFFLNKTKAIEKKESNHDFKTIANI